MSNIISRSVKKIREDGIGSFARRALFLIKYHAPYVPSVIRGKYRITTPTDRDISLRVESLEEAHLVSFSERDMLEEWMTSLRPDDTVWDIGAGHGVYLTGAAYISKVAIGFEPTLENYEKTKQTLSVNDVEADVHNFALGAERTKAELQTETVNTATRTVYSESGTVDVYRGDELDDIPAPDAVKIDVEGSEVEVIEGLDGLLHNVRIILLEVHGGRHDIEDRGHDRETLRDTLEDYGFDVSIINKVPDGNSHWLCEKPE